MFNRRNTKKLMEACHGDADKAARIIREKINKKPDETGYISPDEFRSFREIAEGLDIELGSADLWEATTASQFSTIVGVLISKKIMDSYNAAAKVGNLLVSPFNSQLETDKIPGLYLKGDMEDVEEKGEYPHLGDIGEKYVEIDHQKRGLILDITDEAVRFDRTGRIMLLAGRIGERMAIDRETRILNRVQDITNYKSWYPSGTQDDIYQNAQGAGDAHAYDNVITDALADYTDLDAANLLLSLMKDDNGEYILANAKIILVPKALEVMAKRLIKNTVLPGAANEERNPFADVVDVVSSALCDAQSSTAWYWGDFKKMFLEKIVIPMEVRSRRFRDNNEDAWNRDVVASYKARYDSQVGAIDYRFVVKSTGAA